MYTWSLILLFARNIGLMIYKSSTPQQKCTCAREQTENIYFIENKLSNVRHLKNDDAILLYTMTFTTDPFFSKFYQEEQDQSCLRYGTPLLGAPPRSTPHSNVRAHFGAARLYRLVRLHGIHHLLHTAELVLHPLHSSIPFSHEVH